MMRRLLATTALVGCLLSGGPAEAGPAIPLVAALAPALAAAGFSTVAVAVISIGMSVAAALLAPKPKVPGQIGDGRTHQVRQPVTPRRIILGMAKVSGPLVFWHTRGNKSRDNILHEVIPLAGHPIAAFIEHYLDEKPCILGPDGRAMNDPWIVGSGDHHVRMWAYDGTQTTADPVLVANTAGKWTGSHVGFGVPYVHAELTYGAFNQGPEVFPNGVPNYTATVLGAKVYDPRDGSTRWTDNAALLIAHYLTMPEEDGGFGAGFDEVDWDLIAAEANVCDQIVARKEASGALIAEDGVLTVGDMSLPNGTRVRFSSSGTLPSGLTAGTSYYWIWDSPTTGRVATTLDRARRRIAVTVTGGGTGGHTITVTGEPRWTINGAIETDTPPIDVLEDMRRAIGLGQIVKVGGKWRIRAGRWREPELTITDHDLRQGERVLSDAIGRRSGANGIRGTFISPSLAWQPGDFPNVQNAAYVADDAGEELWGDIELPFTISPAMAQRIAKIDLEKRRRVKRMSLPCNLRVLPAWAGQIVTLDFARYRGIGDWPETGKVFEIDTVAVGEGFGIDLSLSEVDPGIWAWDPDTDEKEMLPTPILVSEIGEVVDPENVVATSDSDTAVQDGVFARARIGVRWDFPADEYAVGFELRADRVPVGPEEPQTVRISVPASAEIAYIDGVDWGRSYDVYVRALRTGYSGNWVPASGNPVLVMGDTTPPSPPTDVSATAVSHNHVQISFVTPEEMDFRRSRVYRATTDNFLAAGPLDAETGPLYSVPGWSDVAVDRGVIAETTYYYWVTALDFYENESEPSTPSASVTTPPDGSGGA